MPTGLENFDDGLSPPSPHGGGPAGLQTLILFKHWRMGAFFSFPTPDQYTSPLTQVRENSTKYRAEIRMALKTVVFNQACSLLPGAHFSLSHLEEGNATGYLVGRGC